MTMIARRINEDYCIDTELYFYHWFCGKVAWFDHGRNLFGDRSHRIAKHRIGDHSLYDRSKPAHVATNHQTAEVLKVICQNAT